MSITIKKIKNDPHKYHAILLGEQCVGHIQFDGMWNVSIYENLQSKKIVAESYFHLSDAKAWAIHRGELLAAYMEKKCKTCNSTENLGESIGNEEYLCDTCADNLAAWLKESHFADEKYPESLIHSVTQR